MDEELFEIAKDNDLTLEEAQELKEFAEENDLDVDDALEIWKEMKNVFLFKLTTLSNIIYPCPTKQSQTPILLQSSQFKPEQPLAKIWKYQT